MNSKEKTEFLKSKGLKDGDLVSFKVENQISGGYYGPTKGYLNLKKDEPTIDCTYKGNKVKASIQNGLDAYIGSICKMGDFEEGDEVYYVVVENTWALEEDEFIFCSEKTSRLDEYTLRNAILGKTKDELIDKIIKHLLTLKSDYVVE